jgi:hypothetical protein
MPAALCAAGFQPAEVATHAPRLNRNVGLFQQRQRERLRKFSAQENA